MRLQIRCHGGRTWDVSFQLRAEHLLTACVADAFVPALRATATLLAAAATGLGPRPTPPPAATASSSPVVAARGAPQPRDPDDDAGTDTGRTIVPRVLSAVSSDPLERPIVIKNFTGASSFPRVEITRIATPGLQSLLPSSSGRVVSPPRPQP